MSRIESIAGIENELTRLYETRGKACRASLFNFIVWAPMPQQLPYFRELIQKVIDKFPCRLIFITQSLGRKLEIDVSIDVKTHLACDLIEIRVPEEELPKLPYLLLPQLLPDLPIYLLCSQDPTHKTDLYTTLFPYTTWIIFDSSWADDIAAFASAFLAHPLKKLRDVNWSLISGWRHTLSRVIDTQDKYASVKKAALIDITYKEGSPTQASYLQAYLKSKLPHCPARFSLTPTSGEGFPGDILALDIDTQNYEFSLTRKGTQITVHSSTPQACDMPQTYPLTHVQRGFNFWRELLFEPASADYLAMLKEISHTMAR